MTGTMKFYLLAELSGWNLSNKAYTYVDYLKNNKAYQILTENVIKVKSHVSHQATSIIDAYNEITFSLHTIKDCFLLENAINYVALHSFEEYYINPLTIDPNYKGDLTTIGELIFDFKGEEKSLNEIIIDNNYSADDKRECISDQLDYYLDDFDDIVYNSMQKVKTQAAFGNKWDTLKTVIEFILILFLNAFFFFILLFPFPKFQFYFQHFSYNIAMSYITKFYALTLFIFDLFFAIYHSYKSRILEPYNYAKRFLKKHSSQVFDDIFIEKEKMFAYICDAIEEKRPLKDDISKFSKLSSSYIDFQAVINSTQIKDNRMYKILRVLNISLLTVVSIVAIVSLVIYIISIIFQAVI